MSDVLYLLDTHNRIYVIPATEQPFTLDCWTELSADDRLSALDDLSQAEIGEKGMSHE